MKYFRSTDILVTAHYLGMIMEGIGIVLLLPIIVALIYQENTYIGFLIPTLLSLGIGYILNHKFKKYHKLKMRHGMIISPLAWLWAGLIGAFIMMICLNLPFENAFLENMSAWTGSGMTTFLNVEILPNSILFLRSLEQWLGGLGVVIIFIGILIRNGSAASKLYESEARDERIKPSITNTLIKTLEIYGIYTAMGIILYIIVGLPIFDAINLTFTSLSTGGMSIKNMNVGFYHNTFVNIITIVLMILGAVSFSVHYKVIKTKGIAILKDIQFQAIIIIISIATAIIYFTSNIKFMDIIFQVTSAITTTGANIPSGSQIALWPPAILIILMILMLIGGSSGSTVGSIKIIRIITFLKGINLAVLGQLSPKGRVMNTKIAGKTITDREIKEASTYIVLTLILIIITWIFMVAYGYEPFESLFNVISAQTNNGVWIGPHHSTLPTLIKYLLTIDMWTGRLEIIPVFVLVRSIYEIITSNIKTGSKNLKKRI